MTWTQDVHTTQRLWLPRPLCGDYNDNQTAGARALAALRSRSHIRGLKMPNGSRMLDLTKELTCPREIWGKAGLASSRQGIQ